MSTTTHDIVAKLWNLCNILKDDGVTYHQYVTELTYLLFLKMAKETGTENQLRNIVIEKRTEKNGVVKEEIKRDYCWDDLERKTGKDRLEFYQDELLKNLGKYGTGMSKRFLLTLARSSKSPLLFQLWWRR